MDKKPDTLKEITIGRIVKINDNFLLYAKVFIITGLYFSVLTFIMAYTFWPRESSLDLNEIEVLASKRGSRSLPTENPQSYKVEESFIPVYQELVSSIYPDNKVESAESSITVIEDQNNPITVTSVPNRINVELLNSQINSIIGEYQEEFGVYLYDLKRDVEIGFNEDVIFPPMSISKLPVGVMTLVEVDKGTFGLDDSFVFETYDVANPTNVLKGNYVGTSFKIRDYLKFLLVDSDNSSILKLENLMGGNWVVNEKVKSELGVEHFFRQPHDATPKDVARVFRGIYFEEYLSHDTNEFLLSLLLNTHPFLQDGIPVGLPPGTKIAHKTGQGASVPNGYIWEDSGIIYGEKTDYVLVILNDHIDIPTARYKIQEISRVVYNTLN